MRWFLLSFLCVVAAAPVPRAYACGGFFCSSAPIIQARETVVYGYEDDGTLTMAVQISYQGRDEDFAWILPVPVPPDEITVGTDVLFTQLRNATEPQFQLRNDTSGTCASASCSYPTGGGGCSLGCDAEHGAEPPFAADGGAADAGSMVEVFSESVVGPYDTVVLGATTAAEVLDWLGTQGYDIPAESEPLLEPYARQGFVFVALRLNANRDSSVIRPIVLRMATGEACLPIRLTAIASTPNLPMNLFFLADGQARSSNYSFVDPAADPELWRSGSFFAGTTWDDAVARAAQELGGHAFATDYADVTPRVSIEMADVSDLADASTPQQLLTGLSNRGYFGTALLLELLEAFIVPPEGADPQSYFNCLAVSGIPSSCGEPVSFDPVGLIAAIEAEITFPARDAQALVDRHPFTTRLSTTMRVEDMTVDPLFVLDPDLPDVPRMRTATLWTRCSSEYYASNAPRELALRGELYPMSEGSIVSEQEFCRARGGTADSGGCSAAANSQASTFVLVTLLGLFMLSIYRRR